MKPRRQKKIESTVTGCLELVNKAKLSREELIVLLGQMLIRSGYSVHWGFEDPIAERPEKITIEKAEQLYTNNPSTGTTLMKVGFDLQDKLLIKIER
jgi:hypothetical protein